MTSHPVAVFTGGPEPEGDGEARRALDAAEARVIFVAYGAPAQELWIERNVIGQMPAVAIGVGGAFDIVSGRLPRAPAPLRGLGLEWAYRLWRQPARWRRMRALPPFALLVINESLALRAQQGRG